MTVEELLIYFLKEVPKSPFNKKKEHLIDFIDTFSNHNIYKITSQLLKDWLDQVQKEGHLKEITMRGIKCQVETFFNFLKEKEIISESPLSTIYYQKQTPSLNVRNLLLPHEVTEILKAIKVYSPGYLYPMLKVFTETACKNQELVDLAWEQVNLKKRFIVFPKKEKIQGRTLKISDELIDILNLKSKTDTQSSKEKVFITYRKESLTCNKLRRAIVEFKEKGHHYKKNWVIADIRHSFAVNFLAQGGDIRELQRILGHGNVYDTKKLYGEAVTQRVPKDDISPFE